METTRSATLLRMAREVLAKRANRAEEEGADSGFTLIELMVVLLILAILLAIAIPTFLGVTVAANDRAAQSNLTNAVTAAKASFVAGQSYDTTAALEAGALNSAEPSLSFAATDSTSQNVISVGVYCQVSAACAGANPDVIVMAAYAKSTGHCWFAADVENAASPTITGATSEPIAGTGYGEIHRTTAAKCLAGTPADFPAAWAKSYTGNPS